MTGFQENPFTFKSKDPFGDVVRRETIRKCVGPSHWIFPFTRVLPSWGVDS